MNETLGRIGVQITVDNKQAVKGFSDTQNAAKATANAIKRAKSQISRNGWSKEARQAMLPYEQAMKEAQANVKSAIATAVQADKATQSAAKATQLSAEKLNKAADATKAAKAKLESLKKAWSDLRAVGGDVLPTHQYKQLADQIDVADEKLHKFKKDYADALASWNQVSKNPPKMISGEYAGVLSRMDEIRNSWTWRMRQNAQGTTLVANNPEYQAMYKEMVALKAREKELLASGGAYETNWSAVKQAEQVVKETASRLREAKLEADGLRQKMAELEASGGAFVYTKQAEELRAAYEKLEGEIRQLESIQSEALYRYAQAYNEEIDAKHRSVMATDEEIEAEKRLEAAIEEKNRAERMVAGAEYSRRRAEMLAEYAKKWANVGNQVKKTAKKVRDAALGIIGWTKKIAHGFGKIYQRIPLLNSMPKTLKKIKRGLMMGAGVRGLIRLGIAGFGVYKALSMMREGMSNLAQYSAQTNSDISMLKSSLATLKNALATAFAPILTAIAPALNYLINLLITAATAVAHFMAAFTGKSTVVVAKRQAVDYAGGMSDVADATGAANDAAQEYQKTLLGFDQMEILNDNSSGSGGGGGGGAGGAGGGFGDMFETVEVSDAAGDLAQRIKDAWARADFSEFGIALADKINNALSNIPWDYIKGLAKKGALSITSFLNAFIAEADWKLMGGTIAEGINTAFTFLGTLASTFNFSQAGAAVGKFISGFIDRMDWKNIGKTVGDFICGAIEFTASAIENIDWEGLVNGIVNFLKGVDFKRMIASALGLAGQVLSIPIRVVSEVIGEVWNGAGDDKGSYGLHDGGMTGGGYTSNPTRVQNGYNWINPNGGKYGISYDAQLDYINKALENEEKTGGKTEKNTKKSNNILKSIWESLTGFKAPTLSVADSWGGNKALDVGAVFSSISGTAKIKTVAELTKIDDRIPTGKKFVSNMLANLDRKNETFSKVTDAMTAAIYNKKEGFDHWTDPMGSWMTHKSEDFDHWTKPMGSWMTHKSEDFDHWTKPMGSWMTHKSEDFSHWTSGMTAWITSVSFASKARQILLSALAEGGVYRNGRWQPVTMAAGGGSFTTGQMFVAREAGPELVGRIGSGTSVMNNDQIVASVSAGVAQGAYQAFVSAFSDTGGLQTNVVLQGDAAKFFRAMQQQAIQYMNSTGLSPFPV